jgi:eukaryotic-like serine/threonine-protein kinase
MTPERWTEVKDVFSGALEHEVPTRQAYVAARCAHDDELRETVQRLLTAHAGAADFIETSPVEGLSAEVASLGRFSGSLRGGYRLGRRVGSGGMGEVYEARDTRTDLRVAIKVLTDTGADAARRLKREAHHALELDHPNICQVYEVGDDETGAFIAMEFLDGVLLSDAVPDGGLPTSTVTDLALQLADAIAHAHARGIIHRDLKRANLMVTSTGRLKVLDFGLARHLPQSVETAVTAASLTEAGVIAGTLSYLPPEVLKGERADARSDVWAFGVVLHELITGRQPFEGRTPFELTSAVLREAPAALPSTVSGGLRAIRDTCLAKDPAERYQDGGELVLALRSLHSGARVRRRTKRSPPTRFSRRAAVVVLALLAAVLGMLLVQQHVVFRSQTMSVAVLPLRGSPDYFAEGITEALIARLGTIDSLRVVSRTSSVRYGDQASLADVRRDLQADVVVRGSVERAGDQVRLAAEMIDTTTGRQLWRNTFSRTANEVLALENDATREIVERLGVPVSASKQTTLRIARAVDPLVYEAYLKGRYHWNKRSNQSLEQATTYYKAAIDQDPTYAPAHAALADCYNQLGTMMVGTASPLDMRPRAKAAAIAAIQADESLAEAHATLGYISHYDWDWATAEREFRRAIELSPNLALAHTWYANYLVSRLRLAEAVAEARRAEQLDPFSLVVVTNVGWTLIHDRRSDEAIAAYRRALALDPTYIQARWRLATQLSVIGRVDEADAEVRKVVEMSRRNPSSLSLLALLHARAGRRDEAVAILNKLLNITRTTYVSPVSMYKIYFLLGDEDNAFAWVDKALQERSNGTVFIATDPVFDGFRDDPRYQRAVERIGLPNGR